MYRMRLLFLSMICLGAIPGIGAIREARAQDAAAAQSSPAPAFLDAATLMAGWEASYGHLKTFSTAFAERTLEWVPSPADPDSRICPFVHTEITQSGYLCISRYSVSPEGFADPDSLVANAFDGTTTRRYVAEWKSGTITPGMPSAGNVPGNLPMGCLIATHGRSTEPPALRHYYDLSKERRVRPALESVSGESCHVMELGPPGNCVAVWLAHGKGMIPMKQQWLAKGEVTYETAVLEVGKSKYGGNDFWYPAKVRILQTGPSYGKLVREVTVASFDPDPRITDKTFQLEFPPGTTVSDATTGAEYTVGAAAPAALTDLANATALRQPPPAVSASTTLPEKAVAATTSAADAAPLVDHRRRNIVVLMIAFLALAALVIVAAKRQRAGREVRRAE